MDNKEKYDLLAEGETGLSSGMGVFPYSKNFQFNEKEIEKSLKENSDFKLISFDKPEKEDPSVPDFTAEIEYKETLFDVDLYICEAENIHFDDYSFANSIDEQSMQAATEQEQYLEVSMYFNSDVLDSFHLQLKIMNAIVPKASLIVDFSSYRLLSGKWLSMTAKSAIPPSPDYLYTIHGVYDEANDGITQYWFHTHGLHRCSSVELEMMNFSQGAEEMNTLINMTVKKFITDPAKENEKFAIGYDGMGINLCWIRWEDALTEFPETVLGAMKDREDEGNVHAEPSGILFAVEDGNRISPEIYASTLKENPIYYITNAETARMSALAKERFDLFEKVFEREHNKPEKKSFLKKMFASKETDSKSWSFLVKLGLTVDDAEKEDDREHLWFEVQSIDKGKITAKLLNKPYWIAKMNEGDIKTYPLDVLTDWIIYSPTDSYSPDSIYMLETV